MHIKIPVLPYVWKYLLSTYGPDPYDLTTSRRNDLRMRFQWMTCSAEIIPQTEKLPGKYVVLDLGEDTQLIKVYKEHEQLLKLGSFFQHEFMLMLRKYVEAQEQLAQQWKAGPRQWNQKMAVDMFLQAHGIEPYEYDHFSVYRQLNRLKNFDRSQLAEKIRKKFGFTVSENEPPYKLPRFTYGKEKYIYFWAVSRSMEDLMMKKLYVPTKILQRGDWLPWVKSSMEIITDMLTKGHTVS